MNKPTILLALFALISSVGSVKAQQVTLQVPSECNIYGAGHASPPAGVAGGPGILPIQVPVTLSTGSYVELDDVSGTVDYNFGGPVDNDGNQNPPQGRDTLSFGGISGILSTTRSFFLTGVFLAATEPQDPAPDQSQFSSYDFQDLHPQLRQLFFVGDGRGLNGVRQRFYTPPEATRFFLGFVDNGPDNLPGYYTDNTGSFTVTLHTGMPDTTIEPVIQIRPAYFITFSTASGRTYQAQWTDNLTVASWTNIGTSVIGTGASETIFDPPLDVSRRFYRVVSTSP
jgi:hypothetical protein